MQKDFHFTTTYVLARLAGFEKEEAEIISSSSQFIDDATNSGRLLFQNFAGYEFFASAHKMLDYRNFEELQNHYSWIPFHFLPGNVVDDPLFEGSDEFVKRLICQPNSDVAKLMLKKVFAKKNKNYNLYQLGITMHVYADTWAHQKFCGISHKVNSVEKILDFDDGSTHKPHTNRIKNYFKKRWWERIFSFLLTEYSPLGHGPALSMPDKPFLKWQYVNYAGKIVRRDNTLIFMEACDHIYSALKSYKENEDSLVMHELPVVDRTKIEELFRTNISDDQQVRCVAWKQVIREGGFSFGPEEISYRGEGINGWKNQLKFQLPDELGGVSKNIEFTKCFLDSPWKLFHDEIMDHRRTILYEVLPSFNLTVV